MTARAAVGRPIYAWDHAPQLPDRPPRPVFAGVDDFVPTSTATSALSTPVRLTAVTITRVVVASGRRCVLSHPGSTSLAQAPLESERTVQSHTRESPAAVILTSRSPVSGSRAMVAVGLAGGFEPSHGDAGTSAGSRYCDATFSARLSGFFISAVMLKWMWPASPLSRARIVSIWSTISCDVKRDPFAPASPIR